MNWLIVTLIVIGLIYYLIKKGNNKFWKLVHKHPFEAYEYFMTNECWYVVHPNDFKNKPPQGNWSGPYIVQIPGIGRIKVYGKESEFEANQMEFIKRIENS
jgi:hypothetical protein